MMMESRNTNLEQSEGYSGLIHKKHFCQQPYDIIIYEESPDELNEQQHLSAAADEHKCNVVVHAYECQEMCRHSSGDDNRQNESMCDHEEPQCVAEIPSEYLTIM